jgi:urease accessory protein
VATDIGFTRYRLTKVRKSETSDLRVFRQGHAQSLAIKEKSGVKGVSAAQSDVFAENRARGAVTLGVAAADGGTRRRRSHESGCLRARFPNAERGELEAVLLNTAGGIAGGDQLTIDIAVEAGARLMVTTAAAEKIYRSHGPDAAIEVRLEVENGGLLRWLPQETILFDGARVTRSIDVALSETASLVLAEAVVFGRAAMGEQLGHGRFLDRWRVRRAGRLIYADAVRLEGAIADRLARPAAADRGEAVATVLIMSPNQSEIARLLAARQDFRGEVGVSSWNGLTAARLCAKRAIDLRHDLTQILSTSGPLPRLWLN